MHFFIKINHDEDRRYVRTAKMNPTPLVGKNWIEVSEFEYIAHERANGFNGVGRVTSAFGLPHRAGQVTR